MEIGEKIKEERKKKNFTQEELATRLGTTRRSLINYEQGKRIPSEDIIEKMCLLFNTTKDYFLNKEDNFLVKSHEMYGSKGSKKAQALIMEANALFAGGDLDEDDKDLFMESISKIYFKAKKRAQEKYTPIKSQKKMSDVFNE